MPTYDYRCTKCDHRFEMLQTMSEPPRKRCPECGCKVERLIGAGAGLIFKGSGFYITDYVRNKSGNEESNNQPKSDGESKQTSDGESKQTSEKKPQKKTESKKESNSKAQSKSGDNG